LYDEELIDNNLGDILKFEGDQLHQDFLVRFLKPLKPMSSTQAHIMIGQMPEHYIRSPEVTKSMVSTFKKTLVEKHIVNHVLGLESHVYRYLPPPCILKDRVVDEFDEDIYSQDQDYLDIEYDNEFEQQ